MTKKTLKQLLEASHWDVANWANGSASVIGEDCWIFLPEGRSNVPRVCLVAHIDTVHDEDSYYDSKLKKNVTVEREGHQVFHDEKYGVMWSPDGLGADDRAGVYGVMKVFNAMSGDEQPIVILTDGEESGGTGARKVHRIFGDYLKNTLFFIELDRKGVNDCVFYNNEPDEFIQYIESFGFKEEVGSYSDIASICEDFLLCGTNLSAGYYKEHTSSEYLATGWLEDTITKMVAIVKDAHAKRKVWKNKDAKRVVRYVGYTGGYGNNFGYGYGGGAWGIKDDTKPDDKYEFDDGYCEDYKGAVDTCEIIELTEDDFWEEVAEHGALFEDEHNECILYWCYSCDLHYGPQYQGVATLGICPMCTDQPWVEYRIGEETKTRLPLRGV